MKLKGPQVQGDWIEVLVKTWQGRCVKRLLPRTGWEELEPGFYMLSRTAKWVRPLFLLKQNGVFRAFEGKEAAEAARREK